MDSLLTSLRDMNLQQTIVAVSFITYNSAVVEVGFFSEKLQMRAPISLRVGTFGQGWAHVQDNLVDLLMLANERTIYVSGFDDAIILHKILIGNARRCQCTIVDIMEQGCTLFLHGVGHSRSAYRWERQRTALTKVSAIVAWLRAFAAIL